MLEPKIKDTGQFIFGPLADIEEIVNIIEKEDENGIQTEGK